ncbi:MAG: zf-HC2 domain-containing protein [Planctomycetales bacterium]|nr:zf-HC2 domain-containing protein [Planctomycetales bacterium]
MTEPQLEELISAYVDGELTADEQSRVERLLETDAEARSLVDELRALSSTLQALPQQRLTENLNDEILARAHALAGNGAAPGPSKPSRLEEKPAHNDSTAAERSPGRSSSPWRGLAWAAIAIAASVMLMLFNTPSGDLELAQGDKAADNFAAAPHSSGEMTAAAEPMAESEEADLFAADEVAKDAPPVATDPVAGKVAMKAGPAEASALESVHSKAVLPADLEQSQPKNSLAGGAGSNVVSGQTDGAVRLGGTAMKGSPPAAEAGQVDAASEFAAELPAGVDAQDAGFDGALIVQVDIKASAARARAFDKLLASEDIVWDEEADADRSRALSELQRRQIANAPVADAPVADSRDFAIDDLSTSSPVEVVMVEASPAQITRTLSRIRANSREYGEVEIAPNDSPAVQQLAESYEFVSSVDVPSRGVQRNEKAPATALADDATKEEKRKEIERRSNLAQGGPSRESQNNIESLTRDDAAAISAEAGERKLDKKQWQVQQQTEYRSQARAKRYYIEAEDLPIQQSQQAFSALQVESPAEPAATQAPQSPEPNPASEREEAQASKPADAPADTLDDESKPRVQRNRAAPGAESLAVQSPVQLRATGRPAMMQQQRAYFLLRVVPDDVAAETAAEAAAETPPAEPAREPAKSQ